MTKKEEQSATLVKENATEAEKTKTTKKTSPKVEAEKTAAETKKKLSSPEETKKKNQTKKETEIAAQTAKTSENVIASKNAKKGIDKASRNKEKDVESFASNNFDEKIKSQEKAVQSNVKKEEKSENTQPVLQKQGKKILFVASEALPYVKTGGLADVMGALPKELNKRGVDARVVLPLYQDIPATYRQAMEFVGECFVTLAWRYQYCGIYRQKMQGVTYYFLDNEYYFKRSGLYGHYDDGERFAFFSKAVLESFKIIDFDPDIIHCNDWHTALVPTFLDTFYRGVSKYRETKTVLTIHNIEFQGKYGTEMIADVLGMPFEKRSLVSMDGCVNFMKAGIESANKVTTVSPTYAQEILTPYFGYGMQNILIQRQFKLCGIVNGIDTISNNPMTDKALFKNYGMLTFGDKVANKLALQELLGFPINANIPMIGMVGRLTHQKGLDLVSEVIEKILSLNIQFVVLGTGDGKYENLLKEMQKKYSGKLRAVIGFSSDMASKIYGASDMFLMPSKFEPCGLSQLLSMRYGSVPIVRETGGLKDTVLPYNHLTGNGCGFTFCTYDANDMYDAIERAVGMYYDYKLDWAKIVRNGMESDYSWGNICKNYIELYNNF